MFLHLNTTDIGKKLYLLDYSYSTKLWGKSEWYVAGPGVDYKLVTILSAPYRLKYELWGTVREAEFVTVAYEDLIVVVLNHFSETKPKKDLYLDDYRHLFPIKNLTPEQKENYEKCADVIQSYVKKFDKNNMTFPFIKKDLP